MKKNKTLLLVSTYRASRQVSANLKYMSALADDDLHLLISDCSQNQEKIDLIHGLENSFVRGNIHTSRIGLYQDVGNLINNNEYEYLAIAGDDDFISLDYLTTSIKILQDNQAAVASYGNYLICTSDGNAFVDSRSALQESAIERVQKGFSPNYFNTMFFAVFRRKALLPWVNFCNGHPLVSVFFDFIHCLSVMAQGKIITHNKGYYLWTGENWDTPELNAQSRSRHYKNIGLPESFTLVHDLHFAIEISNFFLGKYSPLDKENDRIACAQHGWDQCMNRFRNQLSNNEQLYVSLLQKDEEALNSLKFLFHQNKCEHADNIPMFCKILSFFSKEHGDKYQKHFLANN